MPMVRTIVPQHLKPTIRWCVQCLCIPTGGGLFFDYPHAGVGEDAILWAPTCSAVRL